MIRWLIVATGILASTYCAEAADRPANRVLFIGIDGCRPDTLSVAKIPNLQALMDNGAFSKNTNIIGTRKDTADTISGPGWSNVLTGVWPDKHGVLDNNFTKPRYQKFPHFFKRVKDAYPGAKTCSYSTWDKIPKWIVSSADESLSFYPEDPKNKDIARGDRLCTAKAVDVLRNGDPDVMFVYLENVDSVGHAKGFHPSVPEYRKALETVDGQVGQVLDALRARPNYQQENWLVLAATDHGGQGNNHGHGRSIPVINTVFLIVSGDAAARGPISGRTHQVDLVPTALTHLGVPLNPAWKLDGHPVGLKTTTKKDGG